MKEIKGKKGFEQLSSLKPKVKKAVQINVARSLDDPKCPNNCGCYGYKPCTCDTYQGCPKE